MTPRQLDDLIFALAMILPFWVVVRSGYWGIFAGAALNWGLMILAGMVLSATVPDREFNLDGLWIIIGWLPALVFCSALFVIKRGALRVWRKAFRKKSTLPV